MRVVLFNDGQGWRPAIAKPGRKLYTMVHFRDSWPIKVSVSKVKNKDSRFFREMDYDLKKAARRFRRVGVKHMSKAARSILQEVLS